MQATYAVARAAVTSHTMGSQWIVHTRSVYEYVAPNHAPPPKKAEAGAHRGGVAVRASTPMLPCLTPGAPRDPGRPHGHVRGLGDSGESGLASQVWEAPEGPPRVVSQ